jgi:hypothetical protein
MDAVLAARRTADSVAADVRMDRPRIERGPTAGLTAARQGYRVEAGSEGVVVRAGDGQGWQVALGGSPRAVRQTDDRLTIERDYGQEWYKLRPEGIEQGFVVETRPNTDGPLRLPVTVDGLTARTAGDARDLALVDDAGQTRLRLEGLKAWDANGTPLDAVFVADAAGYQMMIDDAGATYPVHIDPLLVNPVTILPAVAGATIFGYSLSVVGDIDGDGFDDVAVAGNGDDQVAIYLGDALGTPTIPTTILGVTAGVEIFGADIAGGDFNGDGITDLVIGAPDAVTLAAQPGGRAYVFFGRAAGWDALTSTSDADVVIDGWVLGGEFGAALVAGDFDNDGFDDLVVQQRVPDDGRLYIFNGGVWPAAVTAGSATTILTGEFASFLGGNGQPALAVGDVDNDGLDDLLAGAPNFQSGTLAIVGAAYLVDGAALASGPIAAVAAARITGETLAFNNFFGGDVELADVNNDGFDDLVIAALGATPAVAVVYYGTAAPLTATRVTDADLGLDDPTAPFSGLAAGDFDSDGIADLVVGQRTASRFFVLESGSGWASGAIEPQAQVVAMAGAGAQYGYMLDAGDLNGDGRDDVVAGAPLHPGNGAVYIHYGAAGTTLGTYNVYAYVSGLAASTQPLELIVRTSIGAPVTASVTADGFVVIPGIFDSSLFVLEVSTQPAGPSQLCTVADGAGLIEGGDVAGPVVTCAAVAEWTLGVQVSGLAGSGLRLVEADSGAATNVAVDGLVALSGLFATGDDFSIQVDRAPTGPSQSCLFTGPASPVSDGTFAAASVVADLVCTTDTFTVGGTVSGLGAGTVTLLLNGADPVTIANGAFTFSALADGTAYAVSVSGTSDASTSCDVTAGSSGSLQGADRNDAIVACRVLAPATYAVTATVSGLRGSGLVLTNNGVDAQPIIGNGTYTIDPAALTGDAYLVAVASQPTGPAQTCVVAAGGPGVVASSDVTATVTCSDNPTFEVGGAVSGLVGSGLLLANLTNGDLAAVYGGAFTFPTAATDGDAYEIVVFSQPANPAQTCSVTGAQGVVAGGPVSAAVVCALDQATLYGTVSGLVYGQVTAYTAWDAQTVGNGGFAFATTDVGTAYAVTIDTSDARDLCVVVSGGAGVLDASNSAVGIVCSPAAPTARKLSATVSGLKGSGLVLTNNGGDAINVGGNGTFTLSSTAIDGDAYVVAVSSQPTNPAQTCSVAAGGPAVFAGGDVIALVTCIDDGGYALSVTVAGLVGEDLQLREEFSGAMINVAADGAFVFPNTFTIGSDYRVVVHRWPTAPEQACSIANDSGAFGAADVTDVAVTCTTAEYVLFGTVSGLAYGQVTAYTAWDAQTVGNGNFSFAVTTAGTPYAVTIATTNPGDVCSVVSGGAGVIAAANSTVNINCAPSTRKVSATVSGLKGSGLVLTNNGGDAINVGGDGTFTLTTALDGSAYLVAVSSQPTQPAQTCLVAAGAGTVSGLDVTAVVTCSDDALYALGVTVTGLKGAGLVLLEQNSGSQLPITAVGAASFALDLTTTDEFQISVLAQPRTPAQTCSVAATGSGTIALADVTGVAVTCVDDTFTVGGTISGLVGTVDLALTIDGVTQPTHAVAAAGAFAFPSNLTEGAAWGVTVAAQPVDEECVIYAGAGGIMPAAHVDGIQISCVEDIEYYRLDVQVSSVDGSGLVLTNNNSGAFGVPGSGVYTIGILPVGTAYALAIADQPAGPDQTCVPVGVTPAAGTVTADTTVQFQCTTDPLFTLSGTVSGVAGQGLQLREEYTGAMINVAADGAFTFPNMFTMGNDYRVVVHRWPSDPVQGCAVASGTGTFAMADVTDVSVSCSTDAFNVFGTVSGLVWGQVDVDLNGTVLTLGNGGFTFPPVTDGTSYLATLVGTTDSRDACEITAGGSGLIFGGPADGLVVTCRNISSHAVFASVSGLSGRGLVLTNNGVDAINVNGDGTFTFESGVSDGTPYAIAVAAQPVEPAQTCSVSAGGPGTIAATDVTAIIVCTDDTLYSIGGTVAGFAAQGLQLQERYTGQVINIAADGAFVFPTLVADGSAFSVEVHRQPELPRQTCTVAAGSGTIATANVASVDVQCSTNTYAVGGTLRGLIAGSVTLTNNGGDNLTLAADGSFAFGTTLADFSAYEVAVLTQPALQQCSVDQRSGVIDGAAVGTVLVDCVPLDADGDGLPDLIETTVTNTDARSADSDGDGLSDCQEVKHTNLTDCQNTAYAGAFDGGYRTNPRRADSDGDGIRDNDELFPVGVAATNPLVRDTDSDGLSDCQEVKHTVLAQCEDVSYTGPFDGGEGTDPSDRDSDGDGLEDGNEVLVRGTDPLVADSDGDGLSDGDEVLVTFTNALDADSDGDGLSDCAEVRHTDEAECQNPLFAGPFDGGWRTDPRRVDSDTDGLSDTDEVLTFRTLPLVADSDADGLTDCQEVRHTVEALCNMPGFSGPYDGGYGTNALEWDTDAGGSPDGLEVELYGTSPLDAADDPLDTDVDGISDWHEVNTVGTDPYNRDSDADGVLDGKELALGTDPNNADSDGDGLGDLQEVEIYFTDPLVGDTDGDLLGDFAEVTTHATNARVADSDADGLTDGAEVLEHLTNPLAIDSDGDRLDDGREVELGTDPNHSDTDRDNVPDGDEVDIYETNPLSVDTDADGLTDYQELYVYGTDPLNPDTDGDDVSDGDEVAFGSDPLDPDRYALSGGGGGCSAAPVGTGGFDLGFLVLLLPMLGLALRRRKGTAVAAALVVVLAGAAPASAALLSFDSYNAQSFGLAEDVGPFLQTRGTTVLPQWAWTLGVAVNHTDNLLVVRELGKVKRTVLGTLITEDTTFALGLFEGLQFEMTLPWHVYVEAGYVAKNETFTSNYLGDLRSGVKLSIFNRYQSPVGLALRAHIGAPTGNAGRYLGDTAATYGLDIISDVQVDVLTFGLNVGYYGRPAAQVPGYQVDDQFVWKSGAALALSEQFDLLVDVAGSTILKDFFGTSSGSPVEGLLGGRWWLDSGFVLSAGAGRGLTTGNGAPALRLFAALTYRAPAARDRDLDAIPDKLDVCPGSYAKFDGAGNWDGCPQPESAGPASEIRLGGRVFTDNEGEVLQGIVRVQPGGREFPIEAGRFDIVLDSPQSYTFEFLVEGYPAVQRRYSLDLGQDIFVDVRLEAGSR